MFDTLETINFEGEKFPTFHGSPFDRGSADSYYHRPEEPHWYPNGTYNPPKVTSADMSLAELRAYYAGYRYNEAYGDKKQW